jgi:hypothetical protein
MRWVGPNFGPSRTRWRISRFHGNWTFQKRYLLRINKKIRLRMWLRRIAKLNNRSQEYYTEAQNGFGVLRVEFKSASTVTVRYTRSSGNMAEFCIFWDLLCVRLRSGFAGLAQNGQESGRVMWSARHAEGGNGAPHTRTQCFSSWGRGQTDAESCWHLSKTSAITAMG